MRDSRILDWHAARWARGLRWLLPLGGCLVAVAATAAAVEITFPSSARPSVSTGETMYRRNCGSCHEDRPSITEAGWRDAHSPAQVVVAALGQDQHEQVLRRSVDAWHVAAYLWGKDVSPETYRTGEALVLEAQARLERAGLWFLFLRLGDLSELRDVDWVMSHNKDELLANARSLVDEEFESLDETERDALVAYIYTSYFVLPWESAD